MKVSFDGIDSQVMTFHNSPAALAVPGDPVAMTAGGTVGLAAADAVFCGICVGGDETYSAVQVRGVITVPYTGTAPAVGYAKLASGGTGKVAAKTAGREYLVLVVDTTAKTVTFVL